MPPKQRKINVERQNFINACVIDKVMENEYHSETQRYAVCRDLWNNRKNEAKANKEKVIWEPPNDRGFLLI